MIGRAIVWTGMERADTGEGNMETARPDPTVNATKKWIPLSIIGGVAVFAGLLLPQLLPSTAAPPKTTPEVSTPANPLTYKQQDWPEPPSQQGMFLRLGLGTVIVLGLCAGTIFLCKRWMVGSQTATAANGQLKLLETLSLGRRCWVQLVHVNNHPVLIGGDATGIKSIVPMPESFSAALLDSASDAPASGMANILAQRFSANLDIPERGKERD